MAEIEGRMSEPVDGLRTLVIQGPPANGTNGKAEDIDATAVPERPTAFTYLTLAEVLDLPDPEYHDVIAGLLPARGSSILVAKPKVGKTTLAEQMARCVAPGAPFLARDTRAGTVLYHAFEELDTEVKAAFKRAGSDRDWPILFHFGDPPDDRLTQLRLEIRKHHPVLVILDTLAYWMGRMDFNDYGEVGAAMRPLHQLARHEGTHILAVHHAGKGRDGGIDSPLGSTALTGNVDTVMWLQETDDARVLQTKQRYGKAMPKTLLQFDEQTGVLSLAGTVADIARQSLEKRIRALMRGRVITESDLRDSLKVDKGYLITVLNRLVEDGRLVRSGRGRRGSPLMYELSAQEDAVAVQEAAARASVGRPDSVLLYLPTSRENSNTESDPSWEGGEEAPF
jgi:hypothetical protein